MEIVILVLVLLNFFEISYVASKFRKLDRKLADFRKEKETEKKLRRIEEKKALEEKTLRALALAESGKIEEAKSLVNEIIQS